MDVSSRQLVDEFYQNFKTEVVPVLETKREKPKLQKRNSTYFSRLKKT